jgi:hypothetical protein
VEDKTKEEAPRTIGELRRRLAQLGNPWDIDPRLSDDDPLPDPPRGGQSEEQVPEEYRLVALEPSADLHGQIAAQPPANPFLRLRWAEVGILNQDEVDGLAPEAGEGEWGAA